MYECGVYVFNSTTVATLFFLFKTFVEAIYLNDEETLNQQTNEKHHIFQWLRLQARQGVAEAEVPTNMSRGQMRRDEKLIEKMECMSQKFLYFAASTCPHAVLGPAGNDSKHPESRETL